MGRIILLTIKDYTHKDRIYWFLKQRKYQHNFEGLFICTKPSATLKIINARLERCGFQYGEKQDDLRKFLEDIGIA